MLTLQRGDLVEFTSLCSAHVWQAVILGFCFKDQSVAIVTDDSGRPPRPVNVSRLLRSRRDLSRYLTQPGSWSPMP